METYGPRGLQFRLVSVGSCKSFVFRNRVSAAMTGGAQTTSKSITTSSSSKQRIKRAILFLLLPLFRAARERERPAISLRFQTSNLMSFITALSTVRDSFQRACPKLGDDDDNGTHHRTQHRREQLSAGNGGNSNYLMTTSRRRRGINQPLSLLLLLRVRAHNHLSLGQRSAASSVISGPSKPRTRAEQIIQLMRGN